MIDPLVQLTLARLREFVREPETLFWAFVFPIIMAVALALAFPARGARPVPVGLMSGPDADSVRAALRAAPDIAVRDLRPGDEARTLREGQVHVIVVPTRPPVYRFDPTRDESRAARLLVDRALKHAAGHPEPWTAQEEPIMLPGSRYVDWLIPGLVGMTIMSTGMWGIGFSIVQARLRKILKRLVASPMRKRDYLLSQMIGRLAFLAPEVTIPLAFGAIVLGMPVNGSVGAIAIVALVGGLSFSGLGVLTASRARTTEAINGILNLTILPMWVLSGVFFSTTNFPSALQPIIQSLPLTALNDALRAVILEGATIGTVAGELLLLVAWGIVPFLVALRVFRWV